MAEKKIALSFAAIEKKITSSIPTLVEEEGRGKGYILYGSDNLYPEYLYGLYNDCTSLKTIVEGTSDFVVGDNTVCNVAGFEREMNRKGDSLRDIIKWTSRDWLLYGSFCLQVIRSKSGRVSEIYYVDMRHIRSDKYNETFYYSEEFGKKYTRTDKVIIYPKYVYENTDTVSSIVFVRNTVTGTYAIPRFSGAVKDCEIERNIDDLHLSSLENGFMGSYVISFLNGVPTEEDQNEIEKNVMEKFCGSGNAGRFILNFADSKDNAVQLDKLDVEDFSEKYQAAAKRSREQIYAAFQAVPALFGIMTESTGFNEQEFDQAFRLYNRTVVKSIQRKISETFDKIFGQENSIKIEPFTIDENNKQEEVVE